MLRPGQSKLHYLFIIKSHLESYPCPININCFWNAGFLLVISTVFQLITGILLALHYTPDINYSYYSIIREVYYGWSLRYIHSNGASSAQSVSAARSRWLYSVTGFFFHFLEEGEKNVNSAAPAAGFLRLQSSTCVFVIFSRGGIFFEGEKKLQNYFGGEFSPLKGGKKNPGR